MSIGKFKIKVVKEQNILLLDNRIFCVRSNRYLLQHRKFYCLFTNISQNQYDIIYMHVIFLLIKCQGGSCGIRKIG